MTIYKSVPPVNKSDTGDLLRKAGLVIPLILGMFCLIVPFLPTEHSGNLPLFSLLGRFHPLILHFPIVLILLLALSVFAGRFHASLKHPVLTKALLLLACISSFVAVLAGYLLYLTEDYAGQLINNHLIGGVLTGFFISLATFVYFFNEKGVLAFGIWIYHGFLMASTVSLGYTSHIGGSLTHGADFLTEPLELLFPPSSSLPDKPMEEMLIYGDVVATLLDAKCVNCHNENKTKGGLLMNSHDALLKSGDGGKPAVVEGKPEESEMVVRMLLPPDHEDRMPPEGKPGLSENEIALVKFWIEKGAPEDMTVGDLDEDSDINRSLAAMLPQINRTRHKIALENEAFEEVRKELEQLAEKINVRISLDEKAEGKSFDLKMKFPPRPFSNEELLALAPYASYFSSISLASADIGDDELFFIGKMENLERLYIPKTSVDGSGLPYLVHLEKLKEINLSFTSLKGGNALHLLEFPNLNKVYIYGTSVGKDVIQALQERKKSTEFILEEGPNY
ncbi:c-type cytochrome domain-containing protein [Pleomorphovibrio marinus]|uniref:c-type cytochrome domain-containing protein n=1 Tax=Pleomorphovibrio marinus TaxID=2164132 RepID=UPI001E56B38D|nr:c-type cytochrome domain-containing protein [Pleomorphovibrio marinus]